jgi:hypothetical protein
MITVGANFGVAGISVHADGSILLVVVASVIADGTTVRAVVATVRMRIQTVAVSKLLCK